MFRNLRILWKKKNSQVVTHNKNLHISGGWPGGAKVLGKLSVPGRPNNLDDSRTRAYCANQPTTYICFKTKMSQYLDLAYRARLFKTNDVVSSRFVNISNINI